MDAYDIRYRVGRNERDRLYRLAKRLGYRLQMCRKDNGEKGTYRVLRNNYVQASKRIDGYGLTLAQVDAWLSSPLRCHE